MEVFDTQVSSMQWFLPLASNSESLHCTVKHEGDKNKYFYHFFDKLTHNFAFTYSVVEHLIHLDPELSLIIVAANTNLKMSLENISSLHLKRVSLYSVTMEFPVMAKD